MIGGQDIEVKVPAGASALDFAVRAVRLCWPEAVFVADHASGVSQRYESLEFHDSSEIVIYQNQAACERWRTIGYDEALKGTMIYFISNPTNLTIVVEDDPPADLHSLVSAIREGLASTFRLYKNAA